MAQGYKDLIVWQKSIELVKEIYRVTGNFPTSEQFGLTSQMRRAAVSIPSNIAEGSRRKGKKEFAQFISIAYGSASELETQLIIARQLTFLSSADFSKVNSLLEEILRMLNKLFSLRTND